jgi:hypothetical protein
MKYCLYTLLLLSTLSTEAQTVPPETKRTKIFNYFTDNFVKICNANLNNDTIKDLLAFYNTFTVQAMMNANCEIVPAKDTTGTLVYIGILPLLRDAYCKNEQATVLKQGNLWAEYKHTDKIILLYEPEDLPDVIPDEISFFAGLIFMHELMHAMIDQERKLHGGSLTTYKEVDYEEIIVTEFCLRILTSMKPRFSDIVNEMVTHIQPWHILTEKKLIHVWLTGAGVLAMQRSFEQRLYDMFNCTYTDEQNWIEFNARLLTTYRLVQLNYPPHEWMPRLAAIYGNCVREYTPDNLLVKEMY